MKEKLILTEKTFAEKIKNLNLENSNVHDRYKLILEDLETQIKEKNQIIKENKSKGTITSEEKVIFIIILFLSKFSNKIFLVIFIVFYFIFIIENEFFLLNIYLL